MWLTAEGIKKELCASLLNTNRRNFFLYFISVSFGQSAQTLLYNFLRENLQPALHLFKSNYCTANQWSPLREACFVFFPHSANRSPLSPKTPASLRVSARDRRHFANATRPRALRRWSASVINSANPLSLYRAKINRSGKHGAERLWWMSWPAKWLIPGDDTERGRERESCPHLCS